MQLNDYYSILGILPTATLKEIKTAYRSLSKKYHPDLNPDNPFAEEKFKEIQQAYEVLSNTERRRQYDWYRDVGNQRTEFDQKSGNTSTASMADGGETYESGNVSSLFGFLFLIAMFIPFIAKIIDQAVPSNAMAEPKAESKVFKDSVKRAEGRIFLYTNHVGSYAGWVNSQQSRKINEVKSILSGDNGTGEEDDRELMISLGGDFYTFNRRSVDHDGDKKKLLYFMGYDIEGKMPKHTTWPISPSNADQNFFTGWRIGVAGMKDITTRTFSVAQMSFCLMFAKNIEGFQILMVGVENDINRPGVTLEEFRASVKVFNKILKAEGIDSTHYALKIFNEIE
jgi:curved DNA-binding protein CbpA